MHLECSHYLPLFLDQIWYLLLLEPLLVEIGSLKFAKHGCRSEYYCPWLVAPRWINHTSHDLVVAARLSIVAGWINVSSSLYNSLGRIIILRSLENELWLPMDEPPDDLYRFWPFAEVVVPPTGQPSWLRWWADLLLEVPTLPLWFPPVLAPPLLSKDLMIYLAFNFPIPKISWGGCWASELVWGYKWMPPVCEEAFWLWVSCFIFN